MNNSMVVRQADHLAARARSANQGRVEASIEWMWRRVLGRAPRANERREALRLARDQDLSQVAWVLLNSNEFIFVR
jgi:hypothetical protein